MGILDSIARASRGGDEPAQLASIVPSKGAERTLEAVNGTAAVPSDAAGRTIAATAPVVLVPSDVADGMIDSATPTKADHDANTAVAGNVRGMDMNLADGALVDGDIVALPASAADGFIPINNRLHLPSDLDRISEMGDAQTMKHQQKMDRRAKSLETLGNVMQKASRVSDDITANQK